MTKRKPPKVQIAGHQTPRDRMWAVIRAHADDFTLRLLERDARIKYNSANTYLQCLIRAGIVEKTYEEQKVPRGFHQGKQFFSLIHYRLVIDSGVETPRISTTGERVTKGDHRQAMWTTLRIHAGMVFGADLLAAFSSCGDMEVSETSARLYMKALHEAGYLEQITNGVQGHVRSTYRLRRAMNTGPRAPEVHSAKRVFDPNLDTVMYQERPELDDEKRDGIDLVDDRTPACIALSGPAPQQEVTHARLA